MLIQILAVLIACSNWGGQSGDSLHEPTRRQQKPVEDSSMIAWWFEDGLRVANDLDEFSRASAIEYLAVRAAETGDFATAIRVAESLQEPYRQSQLFRDVGIEAARQKSFEHAEQMLERLVQSDYGGELAIRIAMLATLPSETKVHREIRNSHQARAEELLKGEEWPFSSHKQLAHALLQSAGLEGGLAFVNRVDAAEVRLSMLQAPLFPFVVERQGTFSAGVIEKLNQMALESVAALPQEKQMPAILDLIPSAARALDEATLGSLLVRLPSDDWLSLEAHVQAASALIDGDRERALKLLQAAESLAASSPPPATASDDPLGRIAALYGQLGDSESALGVWRKCLTRAKAETDPQVGLPRAQHAIAMLGDQGAVDEAVVEAKNLPDLDRSVFSQRWLALNELQKGNAEVARKIHQDLTKQASQLAPGPQRDRFWRTILGATQLADSPDFVTQVDQIDDPWIRADTLCLFGYDSGKQGNWDAAMNANRKAVEAIHLMGDAQLQNQSNALNYILNGILENGTPSQAYSFFANNLQDYQRVGLVSQAATEIAFACAKHGDQETFQRMLNNLDTIAENLNVAYVRMYLLRDATFALIQNLDFPAAAEIEAKLHRAERDPEGQEMAAPGNELDNIRFARVMRLFDLGALATAESELNNIESDEKRREATLRYAFALAEVGDFSAAGNVYQQLVEENLQLPPSPYGSQTWERLAYGDHLPKSTMPQLGGVPGLVVGENPYRPAPVRYPSALIPENAEAIARNAKPLIQLLAAELRAAESAEPAVAKRIAFACERIGVIHHFAGNASEAQSWRDRAARHAAAGNEQEQESADGH